MPEGGRSPANLFVDLAHCEEPQKLFGFYGRIIWNT